MGAPAELSSRFALHGRADGHSDLTAGQRGFHLSAVDHHRSPSSLPHHLVANVHQVH